MYDKIGYQIQEKEWASEADNYQNVAIPQAIQRVVKIGASHRTDQHNMLHSSCLCWNKSWKTMQLINETWLAYLHAALPYQLNRHTQVPGQTVQLPMIPASFLKVFSTS